MHPNSSNPPPRPTLEDLLRFKRAERPAPEFWAEFERGLRQKQLAALMNRPRGWASIRPVLLRGLRWTVPMAVASAAAVVVVVQTSAPQPGVSPATAVVEAPVVASATPVLAPAESVVPAAMVVAMDSPEFASEGDDGLEPMPVLVAEVPAMLGAAEPVAVTAVEPDTHPSLPWSAATLGGPTENFPRSRMVAAAPRRPRAAAGRVSSWTSSLAMADAADTWGTSGTSMQSLSRLDLRVSAAYADHRPTAGANRRISAYDERQLRDLESRFDLKGSRGSIRF